MKRANLLLASLAFLVIPLALYAAPQVAVLDSVLAAGIDPTISAPITDKIIEELVNSRRFTVIDRANVERVLREKEFQLSSGIVRNEEIRRAGEYLGADFVVVANVSRVGSTYVISAKMIDVISGEIAAQASAEREGKIDVVLQLAKTVGAQISGQPITAAADPAAPEKKPPEKKPAEEVVKKKAPKKDTTPAKTAPLEEKRFILGLRGGANISGVGYPSGNYYGLFNWPYVSDGEPYGTFGGNFGLYMVMNTGRYLAWQMELDYTRKGYALDVVEDDFGLAVYQTNYFSFNYLEIPVLAKLRIPGKFSPYGLLGVYFAVWLGGTIDVVYEDAFYQDQVDALGIFPADVEDFLGVYFNGLDYGWVIGLGLDISLRSLVLNTEVKYSGGLRFADEFEYLRNGALTVTAGVGWAF